MRLTPFHRKDHPLKKTSARKRRLPLGCWLSVLFFLGVFAEGQQSTEAVPGFGPSGAPSLQQAFDDQRLAAYSPAQLSALPPIHSMDPGFPSPDACANRADPADRQSQAEWSSGKKLAADLEGHVALISDPNIVEYLNRLQQTIVLNSHLRGCFVVKVVNDVEVNAYSFPGGFLYVTTALILNAENEAQLIAAIAHETGHVTARHFTKIVARQRTWKLLSVAGGPVGYALGRRLGPLFIFKLSRDAEFEADRLALKYLAASGYDPIELARFLQNAFQQEGKPASFFARLFDTHPSTDTRVRRVTQVTGRLLATTDYIVDTSEFHEVKRQVADVMRVTNPGSPHKTN